MKITMIHPTLPPKHVLTCDITNHLLDGWTIAEDQTDEPTVEDMRFYEPDVDATDAVDRDVANYIAEHTKENVCSILENVSFLNAAIAHLGDLQTADELATGVTSHLNGMGFSAAYARTGRRLWQWVTGKDAKTGESRWDKKCLSHARANSAFQRQTRNYEFDTAVELAKHVCAFHWRQLQFLLVEGFEGMELEKEDKKRRDEFRPKAWFDITGAKVIQVKGGGTQLLWDSRKIWLPTSQIKNLSGCLQVPRWLAEKNDMI
tara:strand:+ start:476 stop:1258 length:783 start_codon:yes stop_codon:yes gene_type:complete